MVRIPHCSSFQSSPNVQSSLGGSYITHGTGRIHKWLTSIPRNFCLKSVSQVTRSIFLVSAVTLSCLSCVSAPGIVLSPFYPLFNIHYCLGFLFILSLITAVLKELSQHLSLGGVETHKIHFLGLRNPNTTLFFPSTDFLIHRESVFAPCPSPSIPLCRGGF